MHCIAAVRLHMQHVYSSRHTTHSSPPNRFFACVSHSNCHIPRRRQALDGPHLRLHHALLRMGDIHTMHSCVSAHCTDYPCSPCTTYAYMGCVSGLSAFTKHVSISHHHHMFIHARIRMPMKLVPTVVKFRKGSFSWVFVTSYCACSSS